MRISVGVLRFVVAANSVCSAVWPASSPPIISLSQLTCDTSASEDGPWKAVFLVFKPQSVSATSANACSSWDCVPKQSANFLFASLADPEQTHLSLDFDRALESLMWAVEDDGYAFESYWLPWTLTADRAFPGFGDQQCVKKQRESRRKQPGLLVFRRKSLPERFLLVWLVETPTSGIDKTMLSNAIAYSRTMDPGLLQFRLLGPNFSGSLAPLAQQIDRYASEIEGAHFHVVSGAVTNFKAIKLFSNYFKKERRNPAVFESSIENDQRATALFFDYMRTQLICPWIAPLIHDETAILSEDETVYGDLGLAPRLTPPNDRHRWMMLRYSREIGRLRSSNAKEPPSAQWAPRESANQGALSAMRDGPANPPDSSPDSIAEFSGQQSPASQQAVLQAVAATLRRERASYTGIVATDVLDSVFLAHFLHTADPDTRLFTIDSDLLFLRESEAEPLVGMLSVTNYPLFSRNQHWTEAELKPDHIPRRVQFASRYAQGIYNACRRFLVSSWSARGPSFQQGAADGGEQGLQPDAFLEYERPSSTSRALPPLWLAVVGRDGYWPVALLDEKPVTDTDQSTITDFTTSAGSSPGPSTRTEEFHPEEPSRGWSLLFYCACIFCFAHVFYMLNILSWKEQNPAVSKNPVGERIRFLHHIFNVYPDDHRPTDEERPYLLTATLSLFSSLLLFAFPLFPFRAYPRYMAYFVVAAICLACLLVVAFLLTEGKDRVPPGRSPRLVSQPPVPGRLDIPNRAQ